MKKVNNEQEEIKRLTDLYKNLPSNKMALVQGLIVQAARLRIQLNTLWEDIQQNGVYEMFSQSEKTEPYQRERPSSRLFVSCDKNYQSIIKQLNEMLPPEQQKSKLEQLMDE